MFSQVDHAERRLSRHEHQQSPLLERDIGRALDQGARGARRDRGQRPHRTRTDDHAGGRRRARRRRRTAIGVVEDGDAGVPGAAPTASRSSSGVPMSTSVCSRPIAVLRNDQGHAVAPPPTSSCSSRTAYAAPDAPVMATTSGGGAGPRATEARRSRGRARPAGRPGRSPHHGRGHPLRDHEGQEHDADDAVHGEESRVEPRQVVGPHERVLVRRGVRPR